MAAATNTETVGDSTGLVQVTEKSKKYRRTSLGLGWAPWVLTLVIAAGAGFGGYFMYEKYSMMKKQVGESNDELVSMRHRVAEADQRAMKSRADLTRATAELAAERAMLQRENQDMKTRVDKVDELQKQLQKAIAKNGQITREGSTIKLQMVDRVLFRSGEADLTDRGMRILDKVGATLKKFKNKQIWVQGHTDNQPISNEQFGSNWELSSQRALNVVHYFQDDSGVSPDRLAAVAFSQYRPVSKRRSLNRRIEIVLVPKRVKVVKGPVRTASK